MKKLSLEYDGVNYKTVTDAKWLSFIVEQVISNAVKYTSEGKISICMNEPGILCIEDTGMGIAAEDLPRIFENGYTGFNGREDKLYPIDWEVHIYNAVPHGFGTGAAFANVTKGWEEVDKFIQSVTNK